MKSTSSVGLSVALKGFDAMKPVLRWAIVGLIGLGIIGVAGAILDEGDEPSPKKTARFCRTDSAIKPENNDQVAMRAAQRLIEGMMDPDKWRGEYPRLIWDKPSISPEGGCDWRYSGRAKHPAYTSCEEPIYADVRYDSNTGKWQMMRPQFRLCYRTMLRPAVQAELGYQ